MIVGLAIASAGDDVLPGDRFAGGAMPLAPLLGSVGLPVGVQQQIRAQGAAAALAFEQAQRAAVQWRRVVAAPAVPVVGQGGVVRGRPASDFAVRDDRGPDHRREVGAAGGSDPGPLPYFWFAWTGSATLDTATVSAVWQLRQPKTVMYPPR